MLYQAELSRHLKKDDFPELIKSLADLEQMKKTVSGIRGVFGDDLDLKDTLQYCSNFSSLVRSGKCIVGRDTRESGSMLLETAKAALMKNGIDVYSLGMVPTPVIFREARKYGAGVMVTASHSPVDWNGLKFIVGGRGLNEQELPLVLKDRAVPQSTIGMDETVTTTYLDEAAGMIGNINGHPDIVVDIGGGAARDYAPHLLERLGCKVEIINDTLHGCSRGPDPTTDDLVDLAATSRDGRMGFAFDLDGDRLVVVIEGRKQTPDVTLGLGIARAIEMGCRKFVLSTDSSVAIERLIKERGGSVHRSKVGEANVVNLMLDTGAQAGGEGSSGGFILPEFNYCRDGMLAAGLVASMTDRLGDVLDHMGMYHQIREKIDVTAPYSDAVLEKILAESGRFSEVDTLDGVKGIIDENNWILVRESNTENAIRISGESESQEKCRKNVDDMAELVRQYYARVR